MRPQFFSLPTAPSDSPVWWCISHERQAMTRSEIENLFTYHAPTIEQTLMYNEVNQEFLALALKLYDLLPQTAETTIALRRLHEVRMLANSAIALAGGKHEG